MTLSRYEAGGAPHRGGDGNDGYVKYQKRITQEHLLPLLRRHGLTGSGPVLDVGCGRGGFVMALSSALPHRVVGVDVDAEAVAAARRRAGEGGSQSEFAAADVVEDPLPDGPFALIILRDVAEHLSDVKVVLQRLRESVTPDGSLYVTFPPWRGPYAGHQHHAQSLLKFSPYLHALSPSVFLALAERFEADNGRWLEDVRQICENRLTMPRFERWSAASGWHPYYRRTYLLRPALRRYGFPTVPNGPLGRVPLLGETITTGCEYLLRPSS